MSRAQRSEELWTAYLPSSAGLSPQERSRIAFDRLLVLEAAANSARLADDEAAWFEAIGEGRILFALLSSYLSKWLLSGIEVFDEPRENTGNYRQELLATLQWSDLVPQSHAHGVDPVSVPVPRWLYDTTVEALKALDAGEMRPLLTPSQSGRHAQPYTWDVMRARAIDHVHYLCGQGVALGEARNRVAVVAKISTTTLREWEREGFGNPELAKAAGRLKALFDDGLSDGTLQDPDVVFLHDSLRTDPLARFGARFTSLFGPRYNQ